MSDFPIRTLSISVLAGQDLVEHTPGLYAGVPAEDYHEIDACSASRLTLTQRSPAHAKEAIDHPTPSTHAQRIGTAAHTMILEPERRDLDIDVATQCTATTNKGSQCSYSGKIRRGNRWYCGRHDPGDEAGAAWDGLVVSEDEMATLKAMRDAVRAHPAAQDLLHGAETELTALWDWEQVNPETGEVTDSLPCKARIDALTQMGGDAVLVDLKTTRDASPDAFQRTLWNYSYFRQLAFYRWSLEVAQQGHAGRVEACYIIAVEKEAPYAVAVYEIDEQTLRAGERQIEDLLPLYARCRREDRWPGYGDETQELSLPHWAWDKL